MTVLVYNNLTDRMERYSLQLHNTMPYITGGTLSVREFRARSGSSLLWTDRRTMLAWNTTRSRWAQPIFVGSAFRRIGEGGHSNQSQHYAGMAFDVGQNLNDTTRSRLRTTAANAGVWVYVEPAYLTPTWVHFDRRLTPSACSAGYPLVRQGSRGVYVCVLQDALGVAGISGVAIDGIFGPMTRNAVLNFQRQNGLAADGIVGCMTWTRLTARANGVWRRLDRCGEACI